MAHIVAIDTPSLGDRSYLVHDGSVAFVVDPQRDIDRVLDLAGPAGAEVTHVFETHIHNDYVTGGHALAAATGAGYHVNTADPVGFDRHGVADGDLIDIGAHMRVRVLATPGHTFTHLAYVLEEDGRPVAVFTGGSLLYGSVGRPDLLGPAHTEALAHQQYHSAHRLADLLADPVAVYPTHGFGSFCSATQTDATTSTIGRERRTNPVLTRAERHFIDEVLAGLDAWPAYYAHMAPANAAGPSAPDLSPPQRADADQIRARIEAGEWVVDLRHRVAFAAGHLPGTLSLGLDGAFATYLGWLIPWGTPLTLLGDRPERVAQAQRELVRIGIDRPVVILDVRRRLEGQAGHLTGAVHLPLHELPHRLGEIPDGDVWVHCEAGYRAATAASLLQAAGRRVVAVDDEFAHARPARLPLVGTAA